MPNQRTYARKPSYCRALDLREGDPLVDAYLLDSHRPSTIKQYLNFITFWRKWCEANDRVDLPYDDDDLVRYLTELADTGRTFPFLQASVSAINCFCVSNGHPKETSAKVRTLLRNRRRKHVQMPMRPFHGDDVKAMVEAAAVLYPPLRAARDIALLVHSFATAQRVSELHRERVEDLHFIDKSRLIVGIPKSKGDLEGVGQRVAIRAGRDPRFCPIATMHKWLELSGIKTGPLFREIDRLGRLGTAGLDESSIYRLIRGYATDIGLTGKYGPHSMRRGNASAADALGCDIEDIREHLRHKQRDTTRGYIDERINWERNPTGLLLS